MTVIIDICADNPCVNGTCIEVNGGYYCDCDEGFGGDNCEFGEREKVIVIWIK